MVTHHIAQEIGTDDVHLRMAILSVHHAGELFQLLQHAILEILVLYELRSSDNVETYIPRDKRYPSSRLDYCSYTYPPLTQYD